MRVDMSYLSPEEVGQSGLLLEDGGAKRPGGKKKKRWVLGRGGRAGCLLMGGPGDVRALEAGAGTLRSRQRSVRSGGFAAPGWP